MKTPEEIRDELKRLAASGRFIPGIYNYCDRWCERCHHTARCLNYAQSPDPRDLSENKLFDYLSNIFKASMLMIEESAREMGIDLDETEDDLPEGKEEPFTDPLSRYTRELSFEIHQWISEAGESGESRYDRLRSHPNRSDNFLDALEVILWYNFFFSVKLERAVKSASEREFAEYSMDDANGSAKIALIALDRSIAAWSVLLQSTPEHEEKILDFLIRLARTRRMAEKRFPGARAFIRPGLDG